MTQSAEFDALAYAVIESPASNTTFWSPPTTASAPPGRTEASFTRNAELPPLLFSLADTVTFAAVVLASDRPMRVAVAPDATVGVTVDGLPDVPRFAVTCDLNAMCYPNAIAIAIASLLASVVLYTSRLVRAVAAFDKSLRLLAFSILSVFRLMKLVSTSAFVRGLPFAVPPVSRVTIVDITTPY
jgi:hypothetical protein